MSKIFNFSLVICILSILASAQAMERPEKRLKPEKPETVAPFDIHTAKREQFSALEQIYLKLLKVSPVLTLQSSDNQEITFHLPRPVVNLSDVLQKISMDVQAPLKISLPEYGSTVEDLRKLWQQLGFFVYLNHKQPQLYIPRYYQITTNKFLKGKTMDELVGVLRAAHYLNIPFIINAVSSVIADKVPEDFRVKMVNLLESPEIDFSGMESLLAEQGLEPITRIPRALWAWIAKFITHRLKGIDEEISAADLIITRKSINKLKLPAKEITSFFGLETVSIPETVEQIVLDNNCFYDPTLDPQKSSQPFRTFKNLKVLSLKNCCLRNFPLSMLSGLQELHTLDLQGNSLMKLPVGDPKSLPKLKNILI